MPVTRGQVGSVATRYVDLQHVYTRAHADRLPVVGLPSCAPERPHDTHRWALPGEWPARTTPPRDRDLPVAPWMCQAASCLGWRTEARGQAICWCIWGSRPGSPPASRSFGTVRGGFAPCAPCGAACCAVAGGHLWTTQKSLRSVMASHGHRLRLRVYELQEFSPIAFSCRILQ